MCLTVFLLLFFKWTQFTFKQSSEQRRSLTARGTSRCSHQKQWIQCLARLTSCYANVDSHTKCFVMKYSVQNSGRQRPISNCTVINARVHVEWGLVVGSPRARAPHHTFNKHFNPDQNLLLPCSGCDLWGKVKTRSPGADAEADVLHRVPLSTGNVSSTKGSNL